MLFASVRHSLTIENPQMNVRNCNIMDNQFQVMSELEQPNVRISLCSTHFALPVQELSSKKAVVVVLLSVYISFYYICFLLVLPHVVSFSTHLWTSSAFLQRKSEVYQPAFDIQPFRALFFLIMCCFSKTLSLLSFFSTFCIQVDFLDDSDTSKVFGKQVIQEKQQM